MLIFSLKIDSKWYFTAMFCFVRLFFLLTIFIYCTAYAAENGAGETTMEEATPSGVNGNDQTADKEALIHQFTNTKSYSERRDIFNHLIGDQDPVVAAINLLNGQENPSFKVQFFYFTLGMREANDLSQRDHGAILFGVMKDQLDHNKFLNSLILDQLSTGSVTELSIEDALIDKSVSIKIFRLFLLKKFLEEGVCKQSVSLTTTDVVKEHTLDVRDRTEVLDLFFETCHQHDEFESVMTSLVVEPKLEWSLKEKILLSHDLDYSRVCSEIVLDHLLISFFENKDWHIRNAIIWMLSDVQGECDSKIISFFSDFVQQSSEEMSIELLDFRQTMIQSILWSLVRLGFRNQNENIVSELKKMAMKYDMNLYFRIRAVEALQDLTIYFDSAAQALYEIVRDNKRLLRSDFVTYEQKIRDEQDTKVRDSAFISLVELLTADQSVFLAFLFVHKEELDSDQLYRRKAFVDQPIPDHLDIYAKPALVKLSSDEKVDKKYHEYIQTYSLNNSQ